MQSYGRKVLLRGCVTSKVFETGKPNKQLNGKQDSMGKICIEKCAFPIVDKEGRVGHAVEIFRDINERRLLEEEREQQRLELGRRIRNFGTHTKNSNL